MLKYCQRYALEYKLDYGTYFSLWFTCEYERVQYRNKHFHASGLDQHDVLCLVSTVMRLCQIEVISSVGNRVRNVK